MKRIILLLGVFLILFFDSNVYAVCDTADINRLKGIARNVDITYEHSVYASFDEITNETMYASVYDISVAGVTDEIYIVDEGGNVYYYSSAEDGVINISTSSGERKIFIFSSQCSGVLLDNRTLNLPDFNFNSLSEECQKDEFKDLDICSEFISEDDEVVGSQEFEKAIEEIKKEQSSILYKIKNFVENNIIFVVAAVVVIIVLIIILFLRHRRRSVLE